MEYARVTLSKHSYPLLKPLTRMCVCVGGGAPFKIERDISAVVPNLESSSNLMVSLCSKQNKILAIKQ